MMWAIREPPKRRLDCLFLRQAHAAGVVALGDYLGQDRQRHLARLATAEVQPDRPVQPRELLFGQSVA